MRDKCFSIDEEGGREGGSERRRGKISTRVPLVLALRQRSRSPRQGGRRRCDRSSHLPPYPQSSIGVCLPCCPDAADVSGPGSGVRVSIHDLVRLWPVADRLHTLRRPRQLHTKVERVSRSGRWRRSRRRPGLRGGRRRRRKRT